MARKISDIGQKCHIGASLLTIHANPPKSKKGTKKYQNIRKSDVRVRKIYVYDGVYTHYGEYMNRKGIWDEPRLENSKYAIHCKVVFGTCDK